MHLQFSSPGSAVLVLLVLPLLGACVTRGSYDELAAERDTLRNTSSTLEAELQELRLANDDLSRMLAESQIETESLKGTYDSLVADLESEVASGQVQIAQLQNGGFQVNVGSEVLFPSGSAQLDSEGQKVLEKVAAKLGDLPNSIVVEGHTDNHQIGPKLKKRYATNWELAAARAARVVRLFQEQGIAGTRLRAVSAGPFQPIDSNDTPQGRSKNRRIEIRLLPEEDQ